MDVVYVGLFQRFKISGFFCWFFWIVFDALEAPADVFILQGFVFFIMM